MDEKIRQGALSCRQMLLDGEYRPAYSQFLSLFNGADSTTRAALVGGFPEFFEGGQGECSLSFDFLRSEELSLISQKSVHERLGLVSLATCFAPKRMLEVGRARGGATVLLALAASASECKFVSVDPNFANSEHYLSRGLRNKLEGRGVRILDGFSPGVIPEAASMAGGKFDFVFIDGDHAYESVVTDLVSVLPFMEPGGYIVLHDAHYPGVSDAVQEVVLRFGITDCGVVCRDPNDAFSHLKYRGRPVIWGGLHLLRVTRAGWVRRLCLRLFS